MYINLCVIAKALVFVPQSRPVQRSSTKAIPLLTDQIIPTL